MEVRETDVRRELERSRREVVELRASRMRLALAADAERRSIERALHEGVQQQLVGLAATLEVADGTVDADPAAAKSLFGEIRRDLQQALEETRRLAQQIYPPLLEAGGLRPALRSAAMSADIPIRIEVAAGKVYPPEIAGMVYFCCRDVLDHAAAGTPVAVTVRSADGALTFEIVANGDIEGELPSRDRVEALGGRLTIRQGPGRQISVVGSLPVSG
ncbi:MAG: histidine kinase [Actinomycetota bacterium]